MNTTLEPTSASQKPRKVVVPLAVGLAWGNSPDHIFQEKLDGRFETRLVHAWKRLEQVHRENKLGDTLLAGEYMRGEFYAFDLLTLHGEDCRHWPLSERLSWLDQVFHHAPLDSTGGIVRRVPVAKSGGALLAEVLARGGEGIVRKRLDSPWGTPFQACKRREDFCCVVTGLNTGQSVAISRIINGGEMRRSDPSGFEEEHFYQSIEATPCGSVKLGGGKCDRVRVGSILKITGFGLTPAGQIREPRPDSDSPGSWLVKY